MFENIEVNPLVVYLFIALASAGGFLTCAILAFGRRDPADEGHPEIDEHA